MPKETEEEKVGLNLFTEEKLSQINPQELEKVGKEFLKCYKQKTESMIKDIKSSIQTSVKDE